MKNIKSIFLLLFIVTGSSTVFAQNSTATIQIKTTAECEQCKERLEKAMAYEKGVKKSTLNLDTKVLTVEYNPKKTNPDVLRELIRNIGYDADSLPAYNKAYDKLPECCKKGAHHD